ncbi:mCG1028681, partial [Mus musculus]
LFATNLDLCNIGDQIQDSTNEDIVLPRLFDNKMSYMIFIWILDQNTLPRLLKGQLK